MTEFISAVQTPGQVVVASLLVIGVSAVVCTFVYSLFRHL